MHDPRELHLNPMKRVLRYLRGTTGCPATRRSTFGYCVFLGDNLLKWSSKCQDMLSEAEYRGVANAAAETFWIRNLLRELMPLFSQQPWSAMIMIMGLRGLAQIQIKLMMSMVTLLVRGLRLPVIQSGFTGGRSKPTPLVEVVIGDPSTAAHLTVSSSLDGTNGKQANYKESSTTANDGIEASKPNVMPNEKPTVVNDVKKETPSSYVNKLSPTSSTKSNL
uniref:Uncharacterized protein n=1 Tax=Tanacetum cinerariifolium TaxID=118510 RepID=A0A6L2JJB7_TANCI|nr:hypothetical protein [Tanacetum cinerariifolium]